jgi:hypothetical protein
LLGIFDDQAGFFDKSDTPHFPLSGMYACRFCFMPLRKALAERETQNRFHWHGIGRIAEADAIETLLPG